MKVRGSFFELDSFWSISYLFREPVLPVKAMLKKKK
jgi:hypothetical protein